MQPQPGRNGRAAFPGAWARFTNSVPSVRGFGPDARNRRRPAHRCLLTIRSTTVSAELCLEKLLQYTVLVFDFLASAMDPGYPFYISIGLNLFLIALEFYELRLYRRNKAAMGSLLKWRRFVFGEWDQARKTFWSKCSDRITLAIELYINVAALYLVFDDPDDLFKIIMYVNFVKAVVGTTALAEQLFTPLCLETWIKVTNKGSCPWCGPLAFEDTYRMRDFLISYLTIYFFGMLFCVFTSDSFYDVDIDMFTDPGETESVFHWAFVIVFIPGTVLVGLRQRKFEPEARAEAEPTFELKVPS